MWLKRHNNLSTSVFCTESPVFWGANNGDVMTRYLFRTITLAADCWATTMVSEPCREKWENWMSMSKCCLSCWVSNIPRDYIVNIVVLWTMEWSVGSISAQQVALLLSVVTRWLGGVGVWNIWNDGDSMDTLDIVNILFSKCRVSISSVFVFWIVCQASSFGSCASVLPWDFLATPVTDAYAYNEW